MLGSFWKELLKKESEVFFWERITLFFRFQRRLVIYTALFVMIFSFWSFQATRNPWILVWCSSSIVIAGFRWFWGRRFFRDLNSGQLEGKEDYFEKRFVLGTIAQGFLWSIGGVLAIYGHLENLPLSIVVISGVGIAGAFSYPGHRFVQKTWGTVVLVPFLAYALMMDPQAYAMMALFTLLGMFSVQGSAKHYNNLVLRLYHERDMNKSLVADLNANIAQLQATNSELKNIRHQQVYASKLAALGEMAGGLSHEINNPLAIISLKCQEMRFKSSRAEEVPSTYILSSLDLIEKTSQKISRIVKSFRNIAKEGDKEAFVIKPLKELVEEAVDLCQVRLLNHNVVFNYPNVLDQMTVECRPAQILQVILGMISNSFDAIKEQDKRWISFGVENFAEMVAFSITDSGHGIPEALREKIFTPFFTTKGNEKGTGLGLSVFRAFIQDHHGEILIDDSSPNTRFVIIIPRRQPKVKAKAAA